MALGILHHFHAELVQAQIGDGDAGAHLLQVHHLGLQPLELLSPVFQVALFLRAEQVVIAGGGHDQCLHAGLYPAFQIDVGVQVHVRPEIDQLDHIVFAANTVDPPKPLHQTNRVPVNVVVDQAVAVLQVLAFRNAVGGDQKVNVGAIRHQGGFVLRAWREAGQHVVQVRLEFGDGGAALHRSGDQRSVQTVLFPGKCADMIVKILRCIGKCREYDDFFVAGVDRMLDFFRYCIQQHSQFAVVCRCDLRYGLQQHSQRMLIFLQVFAPGHIVHVGQFDLDLAAHREQIGFLVIGIQVGHTAQVVQLQCGGWIIMRDGVKCLRDQLFDSSQRQLEGMKGAFQTL